MEEIGNLATMKIHNWTISDIAWLARIKGIAQTTLFPRQIPTLKTGGCGRAGWLHRLEPYIWGLQSADYFSSLEQCSNRLETQTPFYPRCLSRLSCSYRHGKSQLKMGACFPKNNNHQLVGRWARMSQHAESFCIFWSWSWICTMYSNQHHLGSWLNCQIYSDKAITKIQVARRSASDRPPRPAQQASCTWMPREWIYDISKSGFVLINSSYL